MSAQTDSAKDEEIQPETSLSAMIEAFHKAETEALKLDSDLENAFMVGKDRLDITLIEDKVAKAEATSQKALDQVMRAPALTVSDVLLKGELWQKLVAAGAEDLSDMSLTDQLILSMLQDLKALSNR